MLRSSANCSVICVEPCCSIERHRIERGDRRELLLQRRRHRASPSSPGSRRAARADRDRREIDVRQIRDRQRVTRRAGRRTRARPSAGRVATGRRMKISERIHVRGALLGSRMLTMRAWRQARLPIDDDAAHPRCTPDTSASASATRVTAMRRCSAIKDRSTTKTYGPVRSLLDRHGGHDRSSARPLPAKDPRSRTDPATSARERLSTRARRRIVPLVRSTMLSMKESSPLTEPIETVAGVTPSSRRAGSGSSSCSGAAKLTSTESSSVERRQRFGRGSAHHVPDLQRHVSDLSRDRCTDRRVSQLQLRLIARRAIGFDAGLRACPVSSSAAGSLPWRCSADPAAHLPRVLLRPRVFQLRVVAHQVRGRQREAGCR